MLDYNTSAFLTVIYPIYCYRTSYRLLTPHSYLAGDVIHLTRSKRRRKKEEKTLNPSIATPDNQDCKNVILEALLLFLKINSSKFANTPIWLYPKSARMKGSNAHKTLRNGQQG